MGRYLRNRVCVRGSSPHRWACVQAYFSFHLSDMKWPSGFLVSRVSMRPDVGIEWDSKARTLRRQSIQVGNKRVNKKDKSVSKINIDEMESANSPLSELLPLTVFHLRNAPIHKPTQSMLLLSLTVFCYPFCSSVRTLWSMLGSAWLLCYSNLDDSRWCS